jgi:ATP-binding cassette subfamily F protein 3
MTLLHLDSLKKHFGAQEILRGASLRLDPGQKIGLVGRNGGGKTTLLRLIEGLEVPDWGSVTLRKGASLGHVPQRPEFEPGTIVRAYVEAGLEEAKAAMRALEEVEHRMAGAQGDELSRAMAEHDRLAERVKTLGGWEMERRVETVMSGIGLAESLWDREARTLSGGERSRVALARELVGGHDLLLLDEPTNHLDLAGIEWIESWLAELEGAVLLVSHDRRLLDNAVDAIVELERGELTRYPGNWSKYLEQKELKFLTEQRDWQEQQDFIRKEEAFIRKHLGSQRTAEAKGREKKLQNIVRVQQPHHDVRRPVIRAPKAERGGELVVEARELAGGYPDPSGGDARSKAVFSNADVRIARGDRVGIVGWNGAGKTTLLKLLAGRMDPLAGSVERGHRAACGYFDQDTSELRNDGTPYTEIRRSHPVMTDQEIRDHLAKFLFRGNDIDANVGQLSGGERARLCLARLVLTKPSWLAMDEPTNHLDLAARTALEEMLGDFEGAMVFVSHDRAFLDGLCNKILEVRDGSVRKFDGNYSAWRAKRAATETKKSAPAPVAKTAPRKEQPAEKPKPPPKPAAKSTPGKVRNPYLFEKLEKRIMALEEEMKALQESTTTEEVYRNPQKLRDAQMRMSEIERDLAVANEEWANWS